MIRLPAASWPARAVFALFGLIALLVLPAGYATPASRTRITRGGP